MRIFRLYFALAGAGLRSQLQYRTNCMMLILMGLFWQGTGLVFIWVILSQFHELAGWSLGEIAFLCGLRLIIHALNMIVFGLFQSMEFLVREAEFDVFLIRPLPPFVQFMTADFHVAAFGDLLGGILIFAAASTRVQIDWSPLALIYLVLVIIGGCLVEAAVKLALSSLAFRTLSVGSLLYFFDNAMSMAGNYPLTIFGKVGSFLFTFILPIAFLAYLPVTVLLHHTNELSVSPLFATFSPLVGVILFAGAYLFFTHELRYYQSAGH